MNARGWRITGGLAVALLIGGTVTAVQASASEPTRKKTKTAAATSFTDTFDSFNTSTWACEYTCPVIETGKARFRLKSGVAPDNYGSWSKARYKPARFTEGKFTVNFSLTERPKEKVWWGVALWDDDRGSDQFNEINFGYTTDQSFGNTQLRFESAKRGNDVSLKVDTGVDLYDGQYHSATLEYDAKHVSFSLDGKLLKTITDPQYIPTDAMDLILGPRLVTGGQPLSQGFTESVDSVEIAPVG
ncbi:hypothetical protein GCM10022223_60570 [Kineosporia mesophila]|uniref:Laminin G domain-containing protein n=1 Tax=Kineosporia mesophila TaxID=566012 RepID=A0ABP7AJY5_9ACTN|nr:hypothetical protein [Kineosporia mesophila]MCD5352508.1 hypothetical protein [Kineosporia mesophila]